MGRGGASEAPVSSISLIKHLFHGTYDTIGIDHFLSLMTEEGLSVCSSVRSRRGAGYPLTGTALPNSHPKRPSLADTVQTPKEGGNSQASPICQFLSRAPFATTVIRNINDLRVSTPRGSCFVAGANHDRHLAASPRPPGISDATLLIL